MSTIRIELDDETLRRLRELAAAERRPAVDQAAWEIQKAVARRTARRRPSRQVAGP